MTDQEYYDKVNYVRQLRGNLDKIGIDSRTPPHFIVHISGDYLPEVLIKAFLIHGMRMSGSRSGRTANLVDSKALGGCEVLIAPGKFKVWVLKCIY